MKILTEKEKKQIVVLNRRKRHLEDSKKCLLDNLKPILVELESVRIAIDDIEIGCIIKG